MLAHMMRMDENSGPYLSEVTRLCAGCHDGTSARVTHVRFQGEHAREARLGQPRTFSVDTRSACSTTPPAQFARADIDPGSTLDLPHAPPGPGPSLDYDAVQSLSQIATVVWDSQKGVVGTVYGSIG